MGDPGGITMVFNVGTRAMWKYLKAIECQTNTGHRKNRFWLSHVMLEGISWFDHHLFPKSIEA
jgi:hypothetical protein